VLCDAGGGTVDVHAYTITALNPEIQMKQAVPATGGLCGFTFLSRRFGEFVKTKLSGEAGWDDEIFAEALERFAQVVSWVHTTLSSRAVVAAWHRSDIYVRVRCQK
jgi:hypothetical protein